MMPSGPSLWNAGQVGRAAKGRTLAWEETGIEGSWIITPKVFGDKRGSFQEVFKLEQFEATVGHPFHLAQANMSVSAAGVLRGIHFATIPPSQAKYVMCVRGSIVDYIVDIRLGSPTFGQSVAVPMDADQPKFVYLSEGLGHAFVALEDDTAVTYLVSEGYNPDKEFGIYPFDETLAVQWPTVGKDGEPLEWNVSPKDLDAPTFEAAEARGLLPTFEDAVAYRKGLAN